MAEDESWMFRTQDRMRRGYRDPLVYLQKAEKDVNAYLTGSNSYTSGISMFSPSTTSSIFSSQRAMGSPSRTLRDHVTNWRPSMSGSSKRKVQLKSIEQLKYLLKQHKSKETTHKQEEVSVTPAQDPTSDVKPQQQQKIQPIVCSQPLTVKVNNKQPSNAPSAPQPDNHENQEKEQKLSEERETLGTAENPLKPMTSKPTAPWLDVSDHGCEWVKKNGQWVEKSNHSPSSRSNEQRELPARTSDEERSITPWASGGSSRYQGKRRERGRRYTNRSRDFSSSERRRGSRTPPRDYYSDSLESRWSRGTRERGPRRTSRDRTSTRSTRRDRTPRDRSPRSNKRGGGRGKGRAPNLQAPQFSDNDSRSQRPKKKNGKKNNGGGKKNKNGGKKKKGGKQKGKKKEGGDIDKAPMPAPLPDAIPGQAPMPAPLPGKAPLPGQAPVPVPVPVPTPKKKQGGPASTADNAADGFGAPSDEEKEKTQRKCCGVF